MRTASDAARELQRLSAAARWAKLSPEARAQVMRTVRAAKSETIARGRIDTTSEPPPKKESAPAVKRTRKPKKAKAV